MRSESNSLVDNVSVVNVCEGMSIEEKQRIKIIKRKEEKKILRKLKSYYADAEKTAEKLFQTLPPDIFTAGKIDKENEVNGKKKLKANSNVTFCGEKMSRPEAIKQLEERLAGYRGRKLSYREKLLKQGLMARIRKKKKQELRKQTKEQKVSKSKELLHQVHSPLLLENESTENAKSIRKERKKKLKKNESDVKNSESAEEPLQCIGSPMYSGDKIILKSKKRSRTLNSLIHSVVEGPEHIDSAELIKRKRNKKSGKNQENEKETIDSFQQIGKPIHLSDRCGDNAELNKEKRNKKYKKMKEDVKESEITNEFIDKKIGGKRRNDSNSVSRSTIEINNYDSEENGTDSILVNSEKQENVLPDVIETKPITDSEGRVYKSKKEMKRAMKGMKKQEKKRVKRKEIKMKKKRKNEVLDNDQVDIDSNITKQEEMKDYKKVKLENNEHLKREGNISDLMFNKFDFVDSENSVKRKSIKDPKRALQVLEKTNNRIKHLKMTGREEKADIIKQRVAWSRAIEKTEGIRVKDDIELIKKSIRKKDGLKNRSKKKWDERNNQLKQKMEEAQKKRRENIMAKKKERKQKKLKRAIKKGRIVP